MFRNMRIEKKRPTITDAVINPAAVRHRKHAFVAGEAAEKRIADLRAKSRAKEVRAVLLEAENIAGRLRDWPLLAAVTEKVTVAARLESDPNTRDELLILEAELNHALRQFSRWAYRTELREAVGFCQYCYVMTDYHRNLTFFCTEHRGGGGNPHVRRARKKFDDPVFLADLRAEELRLLAAAGLSGSLLKHRLGITVPQGDPLGLPLIARWKRDQEHDYYWVDPERPLVPEAIEGLFSDALSASGCEKPDVAALQLSTDAVVSPVEDEEILRKAKDMVCTVKAYTVRVLARAQALIALNADFKVPAGDADNSVDRLVSTRWRHEILSHWNDRPRMKDPTRLTKKCLMELPEGAYLMSGVTDDSGTPLVSQQIPVKSERGSFWKHLRAIRVAGRSFWVFKDTAEHAAFLANNPVPDGPSGSPFPRSAPTRH